MIYYQPVLTTINVNGRAEQMLDIHRVDSQLAVLVSQVNTNSSNIEDNAKLSALCSVEIQEFYNFMEFYFSMMPDMRRAFNDWKVAQKTKGRILDDTKSNQTI